MKFKSIFTAARTRVTGRGRAARECSYPKLNNGIVIKLFKAKMIRFDCNKNFYRMGERYAECMNGRWSVYSFPICISKSAQLSCDLSQLISLFLLLYDTRNKKRERLCSNIIHREWKNILHESKRHGDAFL